MVKNFIGVQKKLLNSQNPPTPNFWDDGLYVRKLTSSPTNRSPKNVVNKNFMLKVVTNENEEALGEVLTIIC